MDAYLAKPICEPELLALVEQLAGRERSIPALAEGLAECPDDPAASRWSPDLLPLVQSECEQRLPRLETALVEGDAEAARAAAHALKGMFLILRAPEPAEAAARVEELARQGDCEGAAGAVPFLRESVMRLEARLTGAAVP